MQNCWDGEGICAICLYGAFTPLPAVMVLPECWMNMPKPFESAIKHTEHLRKQLSAVERKLDLIDRNEIRVRGPKPSSKRREK
jgi:hypothetical protein